MSLFFKILMMSSYFSDASYAGPIGPVIISDAPKPGPCGNSIINTSEECDDGDTKNSNFCTNRCKRNLILFPVEEYFFGNFFMFDPDEAPADSLAWADKRCMSEAAKSPNPYIKNQKFKAVLSNDSNYTDLTIRYSETKTREIPFPTRIVSTKMDSSDRFVVDVKGNQLTLDNNVSVAQFIYTADETKWGNGHFVWMGGAGQNCSDWKNSSGDGGVISYSSYFQGNDVPEFGTFACDETVAAIHCVSTF